MDGGEHTGERMGALQGICIDNFVNGVGVGLGGFRRWQRIFSHPPFGQISANPAYVEYIATHTENTKNPKNPW